MAIYDFSAALSGTYRRFIENVFYLAIVGYGHWMWWGHDTSDIDDGFSELFVPYFLLPLSAIYAVYFAFVRIYEFTRMTTFVQADPEAGLLRMRNLWKKEAIVSAESIRAIEPVRPLPLTSGWKHLALVDDSGYKHIIHHNVEPLGECMETIRSMCPNLKSVDYGGLDRHGLWTIRGKM